MEVSSRRLGLGFLVLTFIFGFYVLVQSTSVRGQVIDVGRTFLMDKGHKVGRVLSIERDIVIPNDMYRPPLRPEGTGLSEDRLCWVVRFEQWGRRGHYLQVLIDVSQLIVLGVEQCR